MQLRTTTNNTRAALKECGKSPIRGHQQRRRVSAHPIVVLVGDVGLPVVVVAVAVVGAVARADRCRDADLEGRRGAVLAEFGRR